MTQLPEWLRPRPSIRTLLADIKERLITMDQSITDLTQAETDLAGAVAASTAATSAATQEIGNLTAQIAANPGDSAAVEAAAKAIEAQVATINQNTASLSGVAASGNTTVPGPITFAPESFVATGGSALNDIVQATGGVGVISFSGDPQNGLTVTDGGNSTAIIGGTAPVAGGNATIDVGYADQSSPPQEGTVTVTVSGV